MSKKQQRKNKKKEKMKKKIAKKQLEDKMYLGTVNRCFGILK